MSDNPFAEDGDRTVVRGPVRAPLPGPASAPAFAPAMAPPSVGGAEAIPRVGVGAAAAAAAPLLDLLGRLSASVQVADPNELRERALRGIAGFEREAAAAGVTPENIAAANYALAASLDDVALATPWGPTSGWGAQSLVSTLHREVRSGERFFGMLDSMQKEPGRYRDALEVAYLCLALGFQGQYRRMPNGRAELDRIREGLYALLAQLRGGFERALSLRWQGVDAPHRPAGRSVPLWTAAVFALGILGIAYAAVAAMLGSRTDDLTARLAAVPPPALPAIARAAPPRPPAPPPAPARPDFATRLRTFLAPEIEQGLVGVVGDANRTVVRIRNRGMFASGSASLEPRFAPLLARIGEALREEPGAVQVIGHSDNQAIRTARFSSNYALSLARAEAALAPIAAATGGDRGRFTAAGRGEAEPVATNATAEGREENRRIEVVVAQGSAR